MRLIFLVLGSAALLLQCRPDEVRALKPGQAAKRKLGPGQTHAYVFSASQGDFLQLELKQQGADLELKLLDSRGQPLGKEDLQLGGESAQILPAVVEATGEYRVEVRPNSLLKGHGRYVLRLDPLRPATSRDRRRAQAAWALYKGGQLSEKRQYDEAADQFEQALRLALEARDGRQAAIARLVWASSIRQTLPERARRELQHARHEFMEQRNLAYEESSLFSLGGLAFQQEEVKEALDFYREAYSLADRLTGSLGRLRQAKVLSSMALVYKHLGDYDLASRLYGDSLDLWPVGVDDEGRSVTLTNRAEFYLALAEPDPALLYLRAALELTEDPDQRVRVWSGMGLALLWKDDPEQSLYYLEQAMWLGRSRGKIAESALSTVLVRIGSVYFEKKKFWHSRFNLFVSELAYRRGLFLARQSRNWSMESNAIAVLGGIYHLRGNSAQSIRLFNDAREQARQRGDLLGEMGALSNRAKAEWALGQFDEAEHTLAESRKILIAFRDQAITDTMRRTVFSLQRSQYSSSIALLMERQRREPQADFAARAFDLNEQARARTLLDDLMRDPIGEEDSALSEEEKQLNRDLRLKRRERNTLDETKALERERLELEIKDLISRLEQSQARHRQVNLSGFEPLSLQEIRKQVLDKDTLLLSYWLDESGSFLWAVDDQSEAVYRLPPKSEIEQLVRDVRHSILDGKGFEEENPNLMAELSRKTLLPVANLLGDHRLLIVADGGLQSIPWASLPDPLSLKNKAGQHVPRLIERHAIDVLPSASVLAALRQKLKDRKPAPQTIAVIANPAYAVKEAADSRGGEVTPLKNEVKPFKDLEHAQDEADAILKLFPPETEFHAFREEANRELVMGGQLSNYQILHFAVHGIADPIPELSGLVLAQVDELGRERNGFVHAFEISRLNLRADLVVLSACQTGVGRNVSGEGPLNLTRAFFSAGARRVIVSLWDVDDEATSYLMKYFYEELQIRDLPPSEALRNAQIRMSQSEQWSHPYYWAGFVLQGEW
jgi:CHAT domain-containing protein/tetratricopeptide (TPR) repeat protein